MLVNGLNLFPLNLVLGHTHGAGYYIDVNSNVYSTRSGARVGGQVKQMFGSNTGSGRYFTLNGTTYRLDRLKNLAVKHKDFLSHVAKSSTSVVDVAVGTDSNRSYAKSLADGIARRGVMIARVEGERLVFGSDPKIHVTPSSYKSEMTRLATEHPGTKFVSVTLSGAVVSGGLKWE